MDFTKTERIRDTGRVGAGKQRETRTSRTTEADTERGTGTERQTWGQTAAAPAILRGAGATICSSEVVSEDACEERL